MSKRRSDNHQMVTRLLSPAAAFAFGVASALLVLVPTYTPMRERYPEWFPLVVWSLGPFLGAVVCTTRFPDRAWELAAFIEGGVIAGIGFDIRARSYLDIPSTVWPLAIVLVLIISLPSLLAGILAGRVRLKFGHRGP
jgi:hypothetical protein